MSFCPKCGLPANPGTNFCGRCGARVTAEPAAPGPVAPAGVTPPPSKLIPVAPPAAMPSGPYPPPQNQPPVQTLPPRLCTKCSAALENDTLFCPACGTKNYVNQRIKTRKGTLLVALRGCNLIKLQLLKTPGMLLIYDDRVFFQSDTPGNNVVISYPEITGVSPHSTKLCIRLTAASGKTYVWSISDSDADFYYYVINLISDYRF